jgi:hypothetical protein
VGYQYITFSEKCPHFLGAKHDFSFLDSPQFPKDVRLFRVDYKPSEGILLRLIIESESYPNRPLDEVLNSPGPCVFENLMTVRLQNGSNLQLCSYKDLPDIAATPAGMIRYARLL